MKLFRACTDWVDEKMEQFRNYVANNKIAPYVITGAALVFGAGISRNAYKQGYSAATARADKVIEAVQKVDRTFLEAYQMGVRDGSAVTNQHINED